jgi:hypothetical protein
MIQYQCLNAVTEWLMCRRSMSAWFRARTRRSTIL